mmetsp:Transcript_34632/g.69272  ORF Transcript_34632/g.69272 Transcript_34632/m.69272 type:complete len:96 (-) Transcript_34632:201-488(-)
MRHLAARWLFRCLAGHLSFSMACHHSSPAVGANLRQARPAQLSTRTRPSIAREKQKQNAFSLSLPSKRTQRLTIAAGASRGRSGWAADANASWNG